MRSRDFPDKLVQSKEGEAFDDTQRRAACESSSGEVVVNISGAFKINIRVMTSSFVSSAKALSWLS